MNWWIRHCIRYSADTGGGGGASLGGEQPAGDTPAGETQTAGGGKNEDLIREKIQLRQRAQAAEKQRDEYKQQLDTMLKEKDELSGRLKVLEFEKLRTTKLKEAVSKLPEDKQISDMAKFEKYAEKVLINPDTLDKDIESFIGDWVVPKGSGNPVNPHPFVGAPSAPVAGDVAVDFNNPAAMLRLHKENPEAYRAAVEAARARMQTPKRPGSQNP